MEDRSIDPVRGSILSIPLLIGLAALVVGTHWLVWGAEPVSTALDEMRSWVFVVVLVGGIVLHEAIHGIAWALAAGLGRDDLKFGFQWGTLTPYAHTKVPIPARAYRIGAAMPGLLLGVLPAIAGIISGSVVLSCWGAIFTSVACGDLLILIRLGGLPGDTLVQDHPTRFGCEIVEGEPSTAPAA